MSGDIMNASCQQCRQAIRLQLEGASAPEQTAQIETHLADCSACRSHANEVRAAAAALQALGSQEIEPRPGFRARWTAAVNEARQPVRSAPAWVEVVEWCGSLLQRNRKPLLALAPVWVLILLLKVTAPGIEATNAQTVSRSPIEVVSALKAEIRLLTPHREPAAHTTPRRSPGPAPRSQAPDREPGAVKSGCNLQPPVLLAMRADSLNQSV